MESIHCFVERTKLLLPAIFLIVPNSVTLKSGLKKNVFVPTVTSGVQNLYDTKSIKSRYIILVFNDWLESTRKASFSRFSSEYKKRKPFFW